MNSVYDVLVNAVSLIETGWTQRSAARDNEGRPCGPWDDRATSWCLTSALYHMGGSASFMAEARVRSIIGLKSTSKKIESTTIWNDTPGRTQSEVLGVLYKALCSKRKLFLPSDYHLPAVIGWEGPNGFYVEDQLFAISDGMLFEVETSENTPTIPPIGE